VYVLVVTTAVFLRIQQAKRGLQDPVIVRLIFRGKRDVWKGLYELGKDRCTVRMPPKNVWPEYGVDRRLRHTFPSYGYCDAWEFLVGTLAHEFTHSLGMPGSLPGEVNCECAALAALLHFRLRRNEINKLITQQERFFDEILPQD
jgi:hypothetical protein